MATNGGTEKGGANDSSNNDNIIITNNDIDRKTSIGPVIPPVHKNVLSKHKQRSSQRLRYQEEDNEGANNAVLRSSTEITTKSSNLFSDWSSKIATRTNSTSKNAKKQHRAKQIQEEEISQVSLLMEGTIASTGTESDVSADEKKEGHQNQGFSGLDTVSATTAGASVGGVSAVGDAGIEQQYHQLQQQQQQLEASSSTEAPKNNAPVSTTAPGTVMMPDSQIKHGASQGQTARSRRTSAATTTRASAHARKQAQINLSASGSTAATAVATHSPASSANKVSSGYPAPTTGQTGATFRNTNGKGGHSRNVASSDVLVNTLGADSDAANNEIEIAIAQGRTFEDSASSLPSLSPPFLRSSTASGDSTALMKQPRNSNGGGNTENTEDSLELSATGLARAPSIGIPSSRGHDSSGAMQNSQPGAYYEAGRAVGQYPAWARNAGANTTAAPTTTAAGASQEQHQEGPTAITRPAASPSTMYRQASIQAFFHRFVGGGGGDGSALEASIVSDAELVCYATSVEDENKRNKRRLRIHICLAVIMAVLAVTVGVGVYVGNQRGADTEPRGRGGSGEGGHSHECSTIPSEQFDFRTRCACFGVIDELTEGEEYAWGRIIAVLTEEDIFPSNFFANASIPFECSDSHSLALLLSIEGISTSEIDLLLDNAGSLPRVLVLQYYVLSVLYLEMNGDDWNDKRGWINDFSVCGWDGVTCAASGRAMQLSLVSNNLTGTLPSELGLLTFLRELRISHNPGIAGTLPSELLKIRSLRNLDAKGCNLTGTIPDVDEEDAISVIDLSQNSLSGTIPHSIWKLERLRALYLQSNMITGSIPSDVGQSTLLESLELQYNALTGSIPTSIGSLRFLESFQVRDNAMTGSIPNEFTQMSLLSYLDVTKNSFTDIPTGLASCNRTVTLYLETVAFDCEDLPALNATCFQADCCYCSEYGWVPANEFDLV